MGSTKDDWITGRTTQVEIFWKLQDFFNFFFSYTMFGTVTHIAVLIVIKIPYDGMEKHDTRSVTASVVL